MTFPVDETSTKIGAPTVLVNNAGIVHGKVIVDLKPEEVQKLVGMSGAHPHDIDILTKDIWCEHACSLLDTQSLFAIDD
jgi:short-subunit dehydrogenase